MGTNVLAIDIGGTAIKWCVFSSDGTMGQRGAVPTTRMGGVALVRDVRQILDGATRFARIGGVGISTGGVIDRETGVVKFASQTIRAYAGTDWRAALGGVVGDAVCVENDAVAALLGERWRGVAVGLEGVYCVTLGTGVGGAYFGTHIERGCHGSADAIGYLACGMPGRTRFDLRGSTAGLVEAAKAVCGNNVSAEALFSRALSGDAECMGVLERWADTVANGLVPVVLIRDPRYVVLGGAISAQGSFLTDLIGRHLRDHVPDGLALPKLLPAKLGNDAALYGAAYPFFEARP